MVSERCYGLGTARSVIRELFEYGNQRAREVGPDKVFDFSIGNPSVPPPQAALDELARLIRESDPLALHGYTSAQGDLAVRQRLSASLARRFGHGYGPDDLYLTVGAAAALCCVFHGLTVQPGDEFIVFAPYFPEYKVFIEGAGARAVILPPRLPDFQIDLAALDAAIGPRTRGVLINSPNNPAGVVYTAQTLAGLGQLLSRRSRELGRPVYLISDEPYREIVYGGVTPWAPDFYPDTIVCYSYSKSLSLPGERLGYVLVGPEVSGREEVYPAVAGAGRTLGYVNAPSLFQRLCAACDGLTADLSVYAKNRELLTAGLGTLGFDTSLPPAGTFYYFLPTLEPDDAAFCERAKSLDLLLVPGSGFGAPGYTRLSFCVPTKRIEGALEVFAKLAKSYGR